MEQIQIFTYKADGNTATLKRINATLIENTKIYFTSKADSYGEKYYSYYFIVSDKICYPIAKDTRQGLENIIEWYNRCSDKCNKEYIIEMIQNKLKDGQYTNNLDVFFCEHFGEQELAKKCSENRKKILEQRQQEMEQARKEHEQKQLAEAEAKRQQHFKDIANAKSKLIDGEWITNKEFELLCKDQNISLTPKFIGWLREYCGDIMIKARTQQELDSLPKGVVFTNVYNTRHYGDKKHKSTKIYDYADKLASAMGL